MVHKRNGNFATMLYPVVSIGYLSGNGELVIARKVPVSFEFGGKLVPKSTTEKQDAFSRLTWSPKFHAWQMSNHDADYMISEGQKELENIRKASQKRTPSSNTAPSSTATTTTTTLPSTTATPLAPSTDSAPTIALEADTVAIVSPEGQVTLQQTTTTTPNQDTLSAEPPTMPATTTTATTPTPTAPHPTPEFVLLSLQVVRQKVGISVLTIVANERIIFDTPGSFAQYEQLKRVCFIFVFLFRFLFFYFVFCFVFNSCVFFSFVLLSILLFCLLVCFLFCFICLLID
jgi:hypothetical protein